MKNKETRYFPLTELRVLKEDGKPDSLAGYAAVFETLSQDLGGFREKIAKGAFADTIKSADVRALFNHDQNYVLGRTKAGTLALEEDDKGLRILNTMPDTQWARDLKVSVDRGDISQMSFGFKTISDSWEKRDDENIRTLQKVELFDVSVVTFPAYLDTSVALRSKEDWAKSVETDAKKKQEDEARVIQSRDLLERKLNLRKRQL